MFSVLCTLQAIQKYGTQEEEWKLTEKKKQRTHGLVGAEAATGGIL